MPFFSPERILCAVDLSAASSSVIQWAGLFASAYEARLEIFHAEAFEYPPYFLPSQEQALAADAERRRAAAYKQVTLLGAENLESVLPDILVVEGHPVPVILERVANEHPGLVVMGSHGRSGISRMRLGSVAETVVREAGVPALVVRTVREKRERATISRVLCPVTFAEHARQSLTVASEIAAKFTAQLIVIHAVEREDENMAAIRNRLCQWIPKNVRQSCDMVELARRGNAEEEILRMAREHAADLIVIGARHHPLLEFTTFGATTERVMRHADAPVLVLPESEEKA